MNDVRRLITALTAVLCFCVFYTSTQVIKNLCPQGEAEAALEAEATPSPGEPTQSPPCIKPGESLYIRQIPFHVGPNGPQNKRDENVITFMGELFAENVSAEDGGSGIDICLEPKELWEMTFMTCWAVEKCRRALLDDQTVRMEVDSNLRTHAIIRKEF